MFDAANIAIFIGVLFFSISFHEMMHAFVAHRLGDDLAHAHGRISLNPLRHIDPFLSVILPAAFLAFGMSPIFAAKPVPINTNRVSGSEYGLALIGVAGPLTNLFLAGLAAIMLNGVGVGSFTADILELFVRLNVALFVFNMLPIPPLDGSRLLYAVAPSPVQRVMEQIEGLGIFVVIMLLFVLLPVLSPILIGANDAILGVLL